MSYPILDARLESVLRYLRDGAVLADVGSDHAYLAIAAVARGVSVRAVASDIHEGPVARAREHVRAYHCDDRITVLQADGLHGLESYRPQDIAICGMGGELVVSILEEAPWLRDPAVRLILQPMTQLHIVRSFLARAGFACQGETVSEDDGRLYQTLCYQYDGTGASLTPLECLLGRYLLTHERHNPLFWRLTEETEAVFQKRLAGKRQAGQDVSYETDILEELAVWRTKGD